MNGNEKHSLDFQSNYDAIAATSEAMGRKLEDMKKKLKLVQDSLDNLRVQKVEVDLNKEPIKQHGKEEEENTKNKMESKHTVAETSIKESEDEEEEEEEKEMINHKPETENDEIGEQPSVRRSQETEMPPVSIEELLTDNSIVRKMRFK
uniref:Uncharacterized protein n=2 Tax=Caenorhabditis japonica TaxID=281687 RepID=A0A8R1HN15_CAEJA